MKGLSTDSSFLYDRSKSTCSFCKDSRHQINKCPHVKTVWENIQKGIIPISYLKTTKSDTDRTHNTLAWYADNGSYWGELYKLTEKSYEKWEKAQHREKRKGTKIKQDKICGYCGDAGHTRAKCEHLDFHKKALVKANRNFRKWFYKEYVEKQGLSTGCIISFDLRTNNGSSITSTVKPVSVQTIITDVNWGSINLLSLLDLESVQVRYGTKVGNTKSGKLENIREFLTSRVLCKMPKANLPNSPHIAGLNYVSSSFVGVPLPMLSSFVGEPLPMLSKKRFYLQGYENYAKIGWGDCNIIENFRIVQKAPQNLGSEWIDGFSDEMSVIFKKFNQEELNFFGIIEHIKDWATKRV